MTNILIDGVSLRALGFKTRRADLIATGQPKKQSSGKEDLTSVNYTIQAYYQQSPTVDIDVFGKFTSPAAADTALYTLYGLLVQPGEHNIVHTDGTSSVSVKAIMHKGSSVHITRCGDVDVLIELKVSLLKTND